MSTFGRLGSNKNLVINPVNQYADPMEPMFVKMIDTEEAANDTTLPEHLPEKSNEEVPFEEPTPLKDTKFKSLISNFSDSMVGIIDDLTNIKKDNVKDDLINAVTKEQRLTHIGVLAIVISVFTLLVKAR